MASSLSVGIEVTGDGLDELGADRRARGIAWLAHRLESAGVSYWVIGAERGEADARRVGLDPSLIATVAARHSAHLGLVVAAAGHRDHPYNLARRLVSVDHAAHGRVGWLALDRDHAIGLDADTDTWTGAGLDAVHTAHAVAAVRTLSRTWPLESVVGDPSTGVFADVTRIRRADVKDGYRITGPLNVPGSVQGDLPVWQQDDPIGESRTAAADLVIVEHGDRIPDGPAAVVVRVRSAVDLAATLDLLADVPGVAGVVLRLRPDELAPVLDDALPAARRRAVVGAAGAGTLRARLGLPAPVDPGLAGHPAAFETLPNPGGRL